MHNEGDVNISVQSINEDLFDPSHALPENSAVTSNNIATIHLSHPDISKTEKYTRADELLQQIEASNHGIYPVVDEEGNLTPAGVLKSDAIFINLLARSNSLSLTGSTLREVAFKESIGQLTISPAARKVLEILNAKQNYAVHMYYASMRYPGLGQENLYDFLMHQTLVQGDVIPSYDEMVALANIQMKKEVAEYRGYMEQRIKELKDENRGLYGSIKSVASGVKDKVKEVSDLLSSKRKGLYVFAASSIGVAALSFALGYIDKNRNIPIDIGKINPKPPIPAPAISSDSLSSISNFTVPSQFGESSSSGTGEAREEAELPEAETEYQKRFDELIDSGCYSIHRYITTQGKPVNVLTSSVNGSNNPLCESNVSWMKGDIPTGSNYPRLRERSRRSESESTFAYYRVRDEEEMAYPIQIGPTCYLDGFSIATNLLKAKHGIKLQENTVIDPSIYADLLNISYQKYLETTGSDGDTALDKFNLLSQWTFEKKPEFYKMLDEVFGIHIMDISVPIVQRNGETTAPTRIPNLPGFPDEFDFSQDDAYVNYMKKLLDLFYPENGSSDSVLQASISVSPRGSHSFIIGGINRQNLQDEHGNELGETIYEIVFLEGNGGVISGEEYLQQLNARTDEQGAVHIELTNDLGKFLFEMSIVNLSDQNLQNNFAQDNLSARLQNLGLIAHEKKLELVE